MTLTHIRPPHGDSAWIKRYRPLESPSLRLFCLPHAGGNAGAFHGWAQAPLAGVETVAVQYPGRQDRLAEECLQDMESLADGVAAALVPLLDRPFALFGHSMGAAVAYEVALRLEHRYRARPQRVFVSGAASPRRPRTHTDVHLRDDDEMVEWFGELGAMDRVVLADPELRPLVLPAMRADLRLIETYRPAAGRTLTAPVTAYVGDADPSVDPDDALAWRELTSAEFSSRVFPGGHFYLSDHEDVLLADIAERLGGNWK
ncbi:thioesterase II family protein [Streptomyces sp. WI04-05B]|uniref:thioesterase II family protein n=1 Tax=Streptomyces TaxID=1883 RepID=UPI0029B3D3E0|nr:MULTISPECIES: alpha/beta fold hydrolase [unclassified Streptomyces]MDX2547308.1 alpha/beta fold hydrolase [Streptomyces sp. WI04-05B]MDX2589796.1 alpha/beta fold hydrolase [Streptomyces sp. WI04-05A]MDX3753466.1 alpha/beta fold hydrolase [Streptomyces sp. AK08-02]